MVYRDESPGSRTPRDPGHPAAGVEGSAFLTTDNRPLTTVVRHPERGRAQQSAPKSKDLPFKGPSRLSSSAQRLAAQE
jgi:hypothetical protein